MEKIFIERFDQEVSRVAFGGVIVMNETQEDANNYVKEAIESGESREKAKTAVTQSLGITSGKRESKLHTESIEMFRDYVEKLWFFYEEKFAIGEFKESFYICLCAAGY